MLRRVFTFVPVLLLLGSAVLLFFINLSGSNTSGVLGRLYFSEVDSRDFDVKWDKARWTLYSLCGVSGGKNSQCTSTTPAYPYSPVDNFDSMRNIPKKFETDRNTYYYLSRFAYAAFLIGIVFSILAIIPTVLSCCVSGFVTGIIGSVAAGIALLFTAAGASLITAAHVMGRNAFRDAGYSANLGTSAFGIMWAAVACLVLSFFWMCSVAAKGASNKYKKHRSADDHESYAEHKRSSSDSSRNENLMYQENNQYGGENSYGYPEGQYTEPQQSKKKFFFRKA